MADKPNDIYELIKDTLNQSDSSFKWKKRAMFAQALSSLSYNTANQIAKIYGTYRHSASDGYGSTYLKDNNVEITKANVGMAGAAIGFEAIGSILDFIAYDEGPNELLSQYINSLIVAGTLSPNNIEVAFYKADKMANIQKSSLKQTEDQANKALQQANTHSTNAKTALTGANSAKTDASAAAAQAERSKQEINKILENLKKDSEEAKQKLTEINKILVEVQAKKSSIGSGSTSGGRK